MEKKNKLALSVCMALAIPNLASAETFTGIAELNLGDIKSSSFLEEQFRGSIPILHTSLEEASQLNVRLAPNYIFREFDVEEQPILNSLTFNIKVRNGNPYIDIRSSQAIDAPFLSFVLEVYSSEGSIYQDYTVLLDPRNYASNTPTKTKQVTQQTAPLKSRSLPSSVINQRPTRVKVSSGDTLSEIASSVKLSGISNRNMAQAIFLSNPRAFSANNANKLKKGYTLKIPTREEVRTIQKTANKFINQTSAKNTQQSVKTNPKEKVEADSKTIDSSSTKTYLVKGGDTLSGIARKFASKSTSFSEMMNLIHSENPHAFSQNKVNLLKKGVTLSIPVFDQSGNKAESPAPAIKKETTSATKSAESNQAVKTQTNNEVEFAANQYKVKNGDTLGSIVDKLDYKDIPSGEVMEAIFTANREAFEKDNITIVKSGSILHIPTRADIITGAKLATEKPIQVAKAASNATPKTNASNTDSNVQQAINHSLDQLEKRLREVRNELKTTEKKLFDLNLTLQNKDNQIKRQSTDIKILKRKLAQVESKNSPPIEEFTESNNVSISTLADLITEDIKREKSLADTITYSGIAILLGLIAVRIGRQKYADRIVASDNYVPISNFEPQVMNENLNFKETLTEDGLEEKQQISTEASERLVNELMDELNHSYEASNKAAYVTEDKDDISVSEEVNATTSDNIVELSPKSLDKANDIEALEIPEETDDTEEMYSFESDTEIATDIKEAETGKVEQVHFEPVEIAKSDEDESNFELIEAPFSKQEETVVKEDSAEDLKAGLLLDLKDKTEPAFNYTHRAQYQSHYGLEETEIDLERRLQTITDEINLKNLKDKAES